MSASEYSLFIIQKGSVFKGLLVYVDEVVNNDEQAIEHYKRR